MFADPRYTCQALPMTAQAAEVFGPYLVYERLGSGGMATVHRALKTGIEGFQRPVALKRLLSQYAGDQEFVRGFVREARLASRLHHSNIAQTFDLGRVEHTYYIAMELVDGVDLRHLLRHIAYSVGPMPVPLTLSLMIQVCDALDYAHTFPDETGKSIGIVHRDVSPSNVIVGRDGVVKIIDFGIAKASSATLFTASGVLKGKFSYMAPESLDGNIDARGDLFAVGVLFYELLTARPLFKGKTDFDTLEMVKRMNPLPPSTINRAVSADVDQLVMTALAKNPAERWQTASAMRNAMSSIAEQPAMRATHLDVPRWIEWALEQPTRPEAWDEESKVIEIEQAATQIGAAPVPARAAIPNLVTLQANPPQPPAQATLLAWGGGASTVAEWSSQAATQIVDKPPPAAAPTADNPLHNPLYQAAAAAYNASEDQRRRLEAVVSLPEPSQPFVRSRTSNLWIFVVAVLCAAAAIGGFYLVSALR
jgi:eukaryotic-like serine/threonine-protein kinase